MTRGARTFGPVDSAQQRAELEMPIGSAFYATSKKHLPININLREIRKESSQNCIKFHTCMLSIRFDLIELFFNPSYKSDGGRSIILLANLYTFGGYFYE
jgi:hypothetical protein